MSGEEYFDTGGSYDPKRIDAMVSYEVLRYDVDEDYEYLYTYRVFNEEYSSVGLGLFSVGLLEGCTAYSPGFEYGLGDEVAPTAQYIVGDPAQSATFLFLLEPIGIEQQSTLLTFWSYDAPGMSYGTLAGGGISQVGNLPAPAPEPCSLLLLGAGAAIALKSKRNLKRRK